MPPPSHPSHYNVLLRFTALIPAGVLSFVQHGYNQQGTASWRAQTDPQHCRTFCRLIKRLCHDVLACTVLPMKFWFQFAPLTHQHHNITITFVATNLFMALAPTLSTQVYSFWFLKIVHCGPRNMDRKWSLYTLHSTLNSQPCIWNSEPLLGGLEVTLHLNGCNFPSTLKAI